ncbi:MAG: thioredoxin [Kiritimatiellia bacterium]
MTRQDLLHVSKENWQNEVIESKVPVLVDFWAEWCPPCRALAPILEELAQELGDKIKIVKVNVDDSPELAAQFGIRAIPTLLLFQNGVVQQQMVGGMSKAALAQKLGSYMS